MTQMTKQQAIDFGRRIHEEALTAAKEIKEFETQMMVRQGYSPQEIGNFFAVREFHRRIDRGEGKSRRVLRMQYSC